MNIFESRIGPIDKAKIKFIMKKANIYICEINGSIFAIEKEILKNIKKCN